MAVAVRPPPQSSASAANAASSTPFLSLPLDCWPTAITDSGSGLLICSSIPCTSYGFEPYEAWSGTEMFANKGIMWVVFGQHRTVFLNTHMQARDDPLGECSQPPS